MLALTRDSHLPRRTVDLSGRIRIDRPILRTLGLMAPRITFLDLPKRLRERIYRECGLRRPCLINVMTETVRQRVITQAGLDHFSGCFHLVQPRCLVRPLLVPGVPCVHGSIPQQLLLVCRLFHEEILPILYGENKFQFRRRRLSNKDEDSKWMFNWMIGFGPLAMACFTNLHFSLGDFSHKEAQPIPNDDNDDDDGVFLANWQAFCHLLAGVMKPHQLKISLVCGVSDAATARSIATPLTYLPTLKDCSLSLSSTPDAELTLIAETVGRYAMSVRDPTGHNQFTIARRRRPTGFPWERLPVEIRSSILSQTDLVVRWVPSQMSERGLTIESEKLSFGYECCEACTDALEDRCCCCPRRRSGFSVGCVCMRIPWPLFLVSRAMYQEASAVFYGQNRLIFSGKAMQTINMLGRLSDAARRKIRMMEIKLYDSSMQVWEDDEEADWYRLMALIKDHLDLSRLWLTINAAWDGASDVKTSRWLPATYRRIIDPIRSLKGLARFHVLFGADRDYESVAEKEVMGAEYDSGTDGKIDLDRRDARYSRGYLGHDPPFHSSDGYHNESSSASSSTSDENGDDGYYDDDENIEHGQAEAGGSGDGDGGASAAGAAGNHGEDSRRQDSLIPTPAQPSLYQAPHLESYGMGVLSRLLL